MGTVPSPHFVIFPFMSHGHTIPLLHLATLLRHRFVAVTIFTTPANAPSIRDFLQDETISIIELPFPKDVDGIPPGVENTEKLPSMSSFYQFARAAKLMQPLFEQALLGLQPATCIISDAFLGWTQQSAEKFGIPRYFFFGMSIFATTLYQILGIERPQARAISPDEPFVFSTFPWLKLTRNDFEPPFGDLEPKGPAVDFMLEQGSSLANSRGMITNSFYELEPRFADYWNQHLGPKSWCVGPLCLAKLPMTAQLSQPDKKYETWMQWLNSKLADRQPVLYVAFGTQAEISPEQIQEIARGLELSNTSFLWVTRPKVLEHLEGFEERVKDRALIVKEWVDQCEVLRHKSIRGFLSHCGWNSVLESICAKVPILALPLMAEQHLNAQFVVEESGVGLRIMPRNGSTRGFVEAEEVEKMVRELMEGEKGKRVRKKVKEMGENAWEAMKEGGSSWSTLCLLIDDACGGKQVLIDV
ncbi:UDP-glycosyltransferase 90A1-like [Nicotiana tomentosiformis]|uniref:UDP-glycosyltransferase 90A1-like n=1 Tax=Nicotiana tomentosiformis TaxID=4098 RepID=UPI00051BF198|nr:UDP-glycosyltransferase 90A1-like [Nicotiana tomentosiformis]